MTTSGGKTDLQDIRQNDWLQSAGLKPGDTFELSGYHDADLEDLYQLHIEGNIDVEVQLNGTDVDVPDQDQLFRGVPLSLDQGRHLLSIKATMVENGQLTIYFGNQGRPVLGEKLFRIRK